MGFLFPVMNVVLGFVCLALDRMGSSRGVSVIFCGCSGLVTNDGHYESSLFSLLQPDTPNDPLMGFSSFFIFCCLFPLEIPSRSVQQAIDP